MGSMLRQAGPPPLLASSWKQVPGPLLHQEQEGKGPQWSRRDWGRVPVGPLWELLSAVPASNISLPQDGLLPRPLRKPMVL